MRLGVALNTFDHLLKSTLFQSEGSSAPVQILGLLECAGISFDQLWMISMDAETWPAPAKPNPFLPISLQRQLHVPHSCAQRELEYSEIITRRITSSAQKVIMSWHQLEGDKHLAPSPLLPDTSQPELITKIAPMPTNDVTHELESIIDNVGPAVSSEERVSGGSFILKAQANCPFKSFADHRLHLEPLQVPTYGLSAQHRGTIIHAILENIWKELRSSKRLNELEQTKLTILISERVEMILTEYQRQHPAIDKIYLDIEEIRLKNQIENWMQFEKKRSPFQVIATEKNARVDVGDLKLKLKIDRIDQLSNGQTVIIDYKSNAPSIQGWLNERLTEPQLPLYTLTQAGTDVKAICYAELKAGSSQFKGIGSPEYTFPQGIKCIGNNTKADNNGWDKLRHQWQKQIPSLANAFLQGEAAVTPSSPSTCQFCHLHSFCRTHK